MTTQQLETTRTSALHDRLTQLEQERAAASLSGLGRNARYMADWHEERAAVRSAYIGAAVTEIASLRAALNGPLQG